MQTKEIQKIIDLLQQNNINEIEYKEKDIYIRVKKDAPVYTHSAETPPIKQEVVEQKNNHTIIKSPIVGTFYRTPSPDSPPYVEKGSKVKKGDPLCTIEAMKLMNQLIAEFDCEIVSILVNQANLVEFDQPLFEVTPL